MIAFDVVGQNQEILEILALAQRRSDLAQASELSGLDASSALNVGLPGVTPTEILSFLTLVFTTGKAALEFFKLLREQLNHREAHVVISDAPTGKPVGLISASTTDQALESLAGQ